MLLPVHPNNGTDDTRGQLGVLVDAAKRGGDETRFLACTLYQPGPGGEPVYVHAKIGIVDDRWLTVGSANLNEHSLFNDTEVNVVTCDEHLARDARLRLWAEHLELPVERGRRRSGARRSTSSGVRSRSGTPSIAVCTGTPSTGSSCSRTCRAAPRRCSAR